MRSFPIYSTVIILGILLLVGCSKTKSKKWLTAEITLLDEFSNNGVVASVKLTYSTSQLFGTQANTIDLGQTDENGYLKIEQEVERKGVSFKLQISAHNQWYHIPGIPTSIKTVPVSQTSENVMTIYYYPTFPYSLRVKNTNCQGATDSIWVTTNHERIFTGCIDSLAVGMYGNSGLGFDQNLTFYYTLKKLGIVNSYTQDVVLDPLTITPVVIEY